MKKLTKKDYLKQANDILEEKDWKDDYQFRSSDYFFIKDLKTKATSKTIDVAFTLLYKTRAHKVTNDVIWSFPFENVKNLGKVMEKLELDIMIKTSDPDIKDQVFGKRFNKQRFNELDYKSKGWKIIR